MLRAEPHSRLRKRTDGDAKPLSNVATDWLDGETEVREHPPRDSGLIREQPEEQMLDLDSLVSHLPGLVLRAPDRLARCLL